VARDQLGLIAEECVSCGSAAVTERPDLTEQGYYRFRCRDCGKQINGALPTNYAIRVY
jgi:transposase-like protein